MADPGISKGGGRSRRDRIFRSGVCFDALSHILYVFVARVVNKIHNVNIVYWLKSNYMRVIQSKFTPPPKKKNPVNFFKRGGGGKAPGAPILDPPLHISVCYLMIFYNQPIPYTLLRWKTKTTENVLSSSIHICFDNRHNNFAVLISYLTNKLLC